MEKIDKEIALELRSEEVQEILGRPPKWIIRIGISFIFIIVIGLFIGSYYIKYPDILQSTIVVTTENLPAGVTAKASGRIDTLLVSEKSMVQKGELLAVIENPAHFDDILLLKKKKRKLKNYGEKTLKQLLCYPGLCFSDMVLFY